MYYLDTIVVQGQGRQKNNSKNKNRNFEEIIFSKKSLKNIRKRILKNIPYFWNVPNSLFQFLLIIRHGSIKPASGLRYMNKL
jgi:hypothetical protein